MTRSNPAFLTYRGRKWLAIPLCMVGLICLALTVGSAFLGWFAVLSLGLSTLFAAYTCLTYGLGESVAVVELRPDGFFLRMPSFRGYYPFWPVQRLAGTWNDVTELRRCRVTARMMGVPYDYVLHTITTRTGRIRLFQSLANDLSSAPRNASLNLDVGRIADEFARRSPVRPINDGVVAGGGVLRNLFRGSPAGLVAGPPPPG